jgi:hypothetical protein
MDPLIVFPFYDETVFEILCFQFVGSRVQRRQSISKFQTQVWETKEIARETNFPPTFNGFSVAAWSSESWRRPFATRGLIQPVNLN